MAQPRALENIRVVDFTWVRAGPWATRWLGAFGAEIIKIEWPENERGRLPSTTTPQDARNQPQYLGQFQRHQRQQEKPHPQCPQRKGPGDHQAADRGLRYRDRDFSSRVFRNWGLGYDVLRGIKPDIVYVSMSGYGHTGRHHHYTTFGPVAQAVSGLTFSPDCRTSRLPAGAGRIWTIPAGCTGRCARWPDCITATGTGQGQRMWSVVGSIDGVSE